MSSRPRQRTTRRRPRGLKPPESASRPSTSPLSSSAATPASHARIRRIGTARHSAVAGGQSVRTSRDLSASVGSGPPPVTVPNPRSARQQASTSADAGPAPCRNTAGSGVGTGSGAVCAQPSTWAGSITGADLGGGLSAANAASEAAAASAGAWGSAPASASTPASAAAAVCDSIASRAVMPRSISPASPARSFSQRQVFASALP